MNKKVLIITYYWPPSGGSGVQRWLKFVKYLPAFEWEPHVFTPENPSFPVRDPSLEEDVPAEAEVMRFPIWEPYDAFNRIAGLFSPQKGDTPPSLTTVRGKSLFQRISTWIRGNLFIPDPRVFWVKPSVRFLGDYLKDNGIHTVVTTGPPHSIHLIGLRLKKKYPHLRWIADFRDPWTEWGMWDSLMVSKMIRKVHKRLEQQVLANADEILTITPFYVRRFEALSGRRVRLLTNGFDEDDFKETVHKRTGEFVIRHIGLINDKCNPRPFMKAVRSLMETNAEFAKDVRVEFIGEVHPDFKAFVLASPQLQKITRFTGNIPHAQLLREYGSSSLLLLVLTGYKDAEGFLPGKLFEYLATGLPVLGTGPEDGDAARLLRETGAGRMIDSDDDEGIEGALREWYDQWKSGGIRPVNSSRTSQFSRKQLTAQLVKIFETSIE